MPGSRKTERGSDKCAGPERDAREEIKLLEREVKKLRQANEIRQAA